MSNKTDIEIIDSVLDGNVDDFSVLIERYQDKIFRYVYSKCGNYDEATGYYSGNSDDDI